MTELLFKFRHDVVPEFFELCMEYVLQYSPKLVGFTCMFDQTIASIALGRLLKKYSADLSIVLGGYALEGPSSTNVLSSFPWIDAVVVGDGEEVVVDLAYAAIRGRNLPRERKPAKAGVAASERGSDAFLNGSILSSALLEVKPASKCRESYGVIRANKIDLEDSPTPDYEDWFDDMLCLSRSHDITITTKVLPVEGSRGCWWGERSHCVFCGIDDETLRYRFKPAEQTFRMLAELRSTYGNYKFRFSDYNMPKAYYHNLLPMLGAEEVKFNLMAEIKANQPPSRVGLMADAGFVELQPGIESFSTGVLKRMKKGVRAIDNVSLLKSGYLNRIAINYNLLYGIPGDTPDDYYAMAERIPRIYHLAPPVSRTRTVVTRFAPLQMDPARFGLASRARHHSCYDVIFSSDYLKKTGFSLDDYAYYFDRNFDYSPELQTIYIQIVTQVEHWKALHRDRFIELSYVMDDNEMAIRDTRYATPESYVIEGLASKIYLACNEAPTRVSKIRRYVSKNRLYSMGDIESGLRELDQHRLIWREEDYVLGLAVPKHIALSHLESGWTSEWFSIHV